MKRAFDVLTSIALLIPLAPIIGIFAFLIWRQDGHSPIYAAERVGRGGTRFRMAKLRSMVVDADKTGVESTGAGDNRITPLGHFIRRCKLDETTQLWNVLKGEMSLVGPRPNTLREVGKYTPAERRLLSVRPGITDIASIVFSDEGDIIKDAADPDDAYDKLIRPWKSRLGILYAENSNVLLDIRLIWLTVLAILDKPRALAGVQAVLGQLQADPAVVDVSRRAKPLEPALAPQ